MASALQETFNKGASMRRAIVWSVLSIASVASAGAQDVARGEKVYAAQKCSVCHSIAGKGSTKGPLDGVGSKLTAEDIHAWIVDPVGMTAKAKATRKPPMPAKYKTLPKEDLDGLVAYLASLKK
jgi:mono/diheme cytochrome c family protein